MTQQNSHLKVLNKGPNSTSPTSPTFTTALRFILKPNKFTKGSNIVVINSLLAKCFQILIEIVNNFSLSFSLLLHISYALTHCLREAGGSCTKAYGNDIIQ